MQGQSRGANGLLRLRKSRWNGDQNSLYVRAGQEQHGTMRIGRTIRELRLASGATLEELAHKAGLDASNLSRIERDLQEPSAGCAWRIADALKVSLGELFDDASRNRHGVVEPLPRGADRQADSLLKVFYRLNENNRGLAVQMLRLLEKTQD